MKTRFAPIVALAALAFILQGCVKDSCKQEITYTKYTPVYMTYDQLRAAVATEAPRPLRHPGKIYFYGTKVFINEFDKGIHVIENADPRNPQNIAFINIPGNVDMAVRSSVLYADSYIDLVAIDISNPTNAFEVGRAEDVFPYRIYDNGYQGDTNLGVVVDWNKEIVTESGDCTPMHYGWFMEGDALMFANTGGQVANNAPVAQGFSAGGGGRETPGLGGSMARFALSDAYLYTVDNSDMHIFSISDLHNPTEISAINIGWEIETIWAHGLSLFIGSQSGMFIYDITTPGNPEYLSVYDHISNCDPVVVDGNYAFVTLRSGTPCEGFTNQLDVVDISDLHNPILFQSFPLFNPHGLGIDGNLLFICDGDQGIKVFDKTDLANITDNEIITYPTINAFDVIPIGGLAMMIGTDGFYQYDYTDINDIKLLSVIPVEGV